MFARQRSWVYAAAAGEVHYLRTRTQTVRSFDQRFSVGIEPSGRHESASGSSAVDGVPCRVEQAEGGPAASAASTAKLFASEALVQSCLDAVQIHGGYGFTTEYGVERELRDAVGSRLYSGTSDIQRAIIARSMGL